MWKVRCAITDTYVTGIIPSSLLYHGLSDPQTQMYSCVGFEVHSSICLKFEMWHDLIKVPNLGGNRDDTLLWRVSSPKCGQRVNGICTSRNLDLARTMGPSKKKICDPILCSAMMRGTVMSKLHKWNTSLTERARERTIYTRLPVLPMTYGAPLLIVETRAWMLWGRDAVSKAQ